MYVFGMLLCGLFLVAGVFLAFMLSPVAIVNFAAAGFIFYQTKANFPNKGRKYETKN